MVKDKVDQVYNALKAGKYTVPLDPAFLENWRGKIIPEWIWPRK